MREEYFAHSQNDIGEEELLRLHLSRVSERAACYARAFGADHEAELAGILHDIGKYGDLFQQRLRGQASKVDHWSAGAWLSLMYYRENGIASAAAIQGHHIGLQSISKDSFAQLDPQIIRENHPLNLQVSESDYDVLVERSQGDGIVLPDPAAIGASLYKHGDLPAARMLDVRMLYSALVDADFIETEAFFREKETGRPEYRREGRPLEPATLLKSLEDFLSHLAKGSKASPAVNELRQELLSRCIESGSWQQGVYTLTAPTGSGKTLSLLAFALNHAAEHDLRRIIVVIPYLSIIEQTADSYRQALKAAGDTSEIVIEDHSLADTRDGDIPDLMTGQHVARLLAENWDAPIIITTSVQFFESLFGNRPSTCRKLHRIPGSVILFDEIQTLPRRLAVPTLAALSHLAHHYRCTIVFSTATQPAFGHLEPSIRTFAKEGWKPEEIVAPESMLFNRAPLIRWTWPDLETRLSWDELACQLATDDCRQALCIVNLKRHALEVFRRLQESGTEGLFHLSTSMCPNHRRQVLARCYQRLASGEACRLVSTQCIEAGVDIDFPVVMRAIGPLDSIVQAAGRCNRNGNIPFGRLLVFYPEEETSLYPDGAYAQAASVTGIVLAEYGGNGVVLPDQTIFSEYYRELYDVSGTAEANKELQNAIRLGNFVDVAKQYRMIEQNAINVLVPYDRIEYEHLVSRADGKNITRDWIIEARPHCISVFRPRDDDPITPHLEPAGFPHEGEHSHQWFILLDPHGEFYTNDVGLVPFDSTSVLIG